MAAFCRMAAVLFPDVLEDTTNLIRTRGATEGVEVKVLPGVSFLDQVLAEIAFDFSLGLQVVLPLTHLQDDFSTSDWLDGLPD